MSESLWRALDLIRSGGMCKGMRSDPVGNHCALGFVDVVLGRVTCNLREEAPNEVKVLADCATSLFPERVDVMADVYNCITARIYGMEFHPAAQLAAFNNHPDTTKDDLEVVFEKAAIRMDEVLSFA